MPLLLLLPIPPPQYLVAALIRRCSMYQGRSCLKEAKNGELELKLKLKLARKDEERMEEGNVWIGSQVRLLSLTLESDFDDRWMKIVAKLARSTIKEAVAAVAQI